jgi:hypothetical protein
MEKNKQEIKRRDGNKDRFGYCSITRIIIEERFCKSCPIRLHGLEDCFMTELPFDVDKIDKIKFVERVNLQLKQLKKRHSIYKNQENTP